MHITEHLAEWVSAISSIFALLTAIWAGMTAKAVYQIESNRDKQANDQLKRIQASQIACWIVANMKSNSVTETSWSHSGILIQNKSESPIYNIKIQSVDHLGQLQPEISIVCLPPGKYYCQRLTTEHYQWSFPIEINCASELNLKPITNSHKWCITEFSFYDSQNNHWIRDKNGYLKEA